MSGSSSFDEALALHQGGRIAEAEVIYRRVLQEQPNHPGALHLLGVVGQQQGDHAPVLELIRSIHACEQRTVFPHVVRFTHLRLLDRPAVGRLTAP